MKLPTQELLDHIRTKYHLSLILLHGSQVTGLLHAKSDIDIAVLSRDPNNKIEIGSLISDLTEIFENNHVDLTNLNHADPLLLRTVTNSAKLLSGSASDFNHLQSRVFHTYNDYLPYLRYEANFVRNSL
jgi:predicted nucleotidyltransferase